MVYKFFDKKSKGSSLKQNQQLANEFHKPIIRKFKKRKVYSSFKNNIWSVDSADMQLISKHKKGTRYLLCVIDLFSKYAWVVPLKDKKGVSIVNGFQGILDFTIIEFKKWLKDNDSMYLTYNEGKSVVAERFIRTLKNRIYKHMTAISKMFILIF